MTALEMSTGHSVDTFFPQHLPFGDGAPGLTDTRFLGELTHGQGACSLIAFK
jgi:hypothetical protein